MAQVKVRFDMDPSRTNAVVGGITMDAAHKAGAVAKARMRMNIQADGLMDTGKLLNSITVQSTVERGTLRPAVIVGSDSPYAHFLEHGTRGHGPVRAKFLRFKPKGSSNFVFARWVRGVRAYRFAQHTVDDMRVGDYL